jgi:hypothetical protein
MYSRPVIHEATFVDDDRAVIPYGSRWGSGGPPEHAYGVTSHSERFAPLHEVARALMLHLGVDPVPGGAVFGRDGPTSSLRFDPHNDDAAPIVFALTPFPGVRLRAGTWFTEAFPACGCDACDEGLTDQAEQLEQTVLAVVRGGLSEAEHGGHARFTLDLPAGWRGGESLVSEHGPALVGRSGAPLAPRDWAPWHPLSD